MSILKFGGFVEGPNSDSGILKAMATELSRRQRKKEKTRVDFARAAVRLFRERGYDATTVDDIAEVADYARSTFFRYFRSKEDVVFVDLADRATSLRAVLENAPADGDAWQVARQAIIDEVLTFSALSRELDPDFVQLWFTEPELERRYIQIVLTAENALAEYFGRATETDPWSRIECQVLATAVLGVGRAIPRLGLRDEKTVIQALEEGFAVLEQGPAAAAIERLRTQQPPANSSGATKRSRRRRPSPANPGPE